MSTVASPALPSGRVPLLATELNGSYLPGMTELDESGKEEVLVISVLILRAPGQGESDF
jgi:hypothetical protein